MKVVIGTEIFRTRIDVFMPYRRSLMRFFKKAQALPWEKIKRKYGYLVVEGIDVFRVGGLFLFVATEGDVLIIVDAIVRPK